MTILNDFPDVDDSFEFVGDSTLSDDFDSGDVSVRMKYSKDDKWEEFDITYVCEDPLKTTNI